MSKLASEKDGERKVRAICGEFTIVDAITFALNKGLAVEVICGPKILNIDNKDKKKTNKEKVIELMEVDERGSSKDISIYISKERPRRHAMLIGHDFLLEDPHEWDEAHETAIVIENAPKYFISHFNKQFEGMKSQGKKATVQDIESMGTYPPIREA